MKTIKELIENAWGYLLGILALAASLFAVHQSGKQSGKKEEQAKQMKKTLEGVEHAKDAREEIESLDDAAVRRRALERLRQR